MKKIIYYLTFLFTFTLFSAQDSLQSKKIITKDTKFGLALSGGGAKGFAHIGILKVIDSLGIKVDYITGTSMGGILGGLYAMGYSGDSLKEVVYNTKWKRVLSNKIPYNKVNISEKDEYNKYIIEFPMTNGLPSLPGSYIEGQYMSEVLNTLTFPAKHINDFSKLPIPVELTSSDIINGGLIMQKKGSLALAIRATLAIPAAFAPVYIDGNLLVDGGLDRNFPVKEVKDMGADYIMGGYTGFRLFTKKEIENPMKMIYQTHAFRSVQDFNEQKKMSDILVDFVTPLNKYTTKDFKNYKEIIKIGEDEAKKHLPEFIALANEQRRLGIVYEHKMIQEVKKPTIQFTYSEDNGTPLTNPSEIQSIRDLMRLKEGEYYDAKSANEAIDRIFGMRQYEKVYYTYTDAGEGLIMNIFIKRVKNSALKLALHYDTEQSVGIIVNYTYRSIEHKFRALATVDISERFKGRIQFQKFLDNDFRWWISAEASTSHLKSNDFILRLTNDYNELDNARISDYIYRNSNINTAINYTLAPNAMASMGIEYNTERINRSIDRIGQIISGTNDRKVYQHNNFDMFFKFNQNSLNEKYYPTSGNNLQILSTYYFGHQYNLYDLQKVQPALYDYLNPSDPAYFRPKNMISLVINENFVFPVNKRLSVKANAFLGTFFSSRNTGEDQEQIPYLFFNQKYNLGGSEYNFSGLNPEFNGFRQKEFPVNSFAKLGLDVQYKLYKHLYLTPSFHYGRVSDELSSFKNGADILGYGLNLGYESILGPININVSKNDAINFWRVYFSIGFKF